MSKQVEQAAKNMKNKTAALTKIMPNTRGPTWLAKQLLCSVAHSIGTAVGEGDDCGKIGGERRSLLKREFCSGCVVHTERFQRKPC
ncbi:hypothetical protein HHI36_015016, partial [Cryptolaemus montrouzieri]